MTPGVYVLTQMASKLSHPNRGSKITHLIKGGELTFVLDGEEVRDESYLFVRVLTKWGVGWVNKTWLVKP